MLYGAACPVGCGDVDYYDWRRAFMTEKPAHKSWLCMSKVLSELINQTYSNDIIRGDTGCFGEVIVIQQVDFIIDNR